MNMDEYIVLKWYRADIIKNLIISICYVHTFIDGKGVLKSCIHFQDFVVSRCVEVVLT